MSELWLHCNKCNTLQSEGSFWFTSCGHIMCTGCMNNGSLAPGRKGQCSVCQKSAGIIEINRSMRPDLLCMFRSPKDLLVEYANKVKGTMDFQNAQRERLIKQLQNRNAKAVNFARGAYAEIAKRVEREKRLLKDRSQKELELQKKEQYIQKLEKKMAKRDQEILNLKKRSPIRARASPNSKKRSPKKKTDRVYPSLNGNTPIDQLSFLCCATSTPNNNDLLGNIAARQLQLNQRSNGSNDPEYDMFCTQKAYEDSPLAGGPNNRFPTTPQLLGMKMRPRTTNHSNSKDYF